jgi:sugar diacid utilization regulator
VASRRRPVTSAAATGRSAVGEGRAEQVEKLLAGDLLDTSGIPYDFDVQNVALVAVGSDAEDAIGNRARSLALPSLIVQSEGVAVWGWLGNSTEFECAELEALAYSGQGADLRMAIGEPARGLAGWRLSHHQARAALPVAMRGAGPVVRYADVALLASVVRDDLLATSLLRLYIEPLGDGRDGGEGLRQTLRAYFAADRNVSMAGEAIGVTRQAVARRLRAVEEMLGRSIASCGADLELALRLESLDAESMPLSAP